jgi:cell division protein FtsB
MSLTKYIILVLLLADLALQYRLWLGDSNVLQFQRLNDRIAELQHEGAKRRERNAALEAEVLDLKQGLDAVEERARQDMDMVKEGEVFVQVIDPQHEDEAPPPTGKTAQPVPRPAGLKPKESKPREAAKPHPNESPATAKPKPAAAKSEKSKPAAASKPAPKPAPAKPDAPKAAPAEPLFDEPIEQRPPKDDTDQ